MRSLKRWLNLRQMADSNEQSWLSAVGGALPLVGPIVNTVGGLLGANMQTDANIHSAKRQFRWQRDWQREQLAYNEPKMQMARLLEAGINPHLAYAKGADAGNWSSSVSVPSYQAGNFQAALTGLGTQLQQARLMSAQADLTENKSDESRVKQDLMRSQKAVLDSNPFLDKTYFAAFVTNLQSIAALKKQEADFMTRSANYQGISTQGESKMFFEIEQIRSKYNLNDADSKIRAEILKSKGFQNDIDKMMRDWIVDGKVNYGQIEKMIPIIMMLFKGK